MYILDLKKWPGSTGLQHKKLMEKKIFYLWKMCTNGAGVLNENTNGLVVISCRSVGEHSELSFCVLV